MAESNSATKTPLPKTATTKTAPLRVKGDGVAYTTSLEILNSEEGRRHIRNAAKIKTENECKE